MKKEIRNWLDSAQYDLETAEHLYNTGRYIYTIFMCHLAIEKLLKAKIEEVSEKIPPKNHNLRYLIKLSTLELPEEMFVFVSKLSDVSIPTRYPEDFGELLNNYNKSATRSYLAKTTEVYQWIRNCIKS